MVRFTLAPNVLMLFVMDVLADTLLRFAVAIVVLAVAVVTVKFGFTFDINRWVELRRERLKERIQTECPHTEISRQGNGMAIESRFFSPSGTVTYQCTMCGLLTNDSRVPGKLMEKYRHDPKLYFEQLKKVDRLAKKL